MRKPTKIVAQNMVGLNRNFKIMLKKYRLPQQKIFFCFLEEIDWANDDAGEDWGIVNIDKSKLVECLGASFKTKNSRDSYLRREIKNLLTNSLIEYYIPAEARKYGGGHLFIDYLFHSEYISLTYATKFRPLLFTIKYGTCWDTICPTDVYQFNSSNSLAVYLRFRTDNTATIHDGGVREGFLTPALIKQMIGMDKESYMRESKNRGPGYKCFDFNNFEKKVLNPICEDLSKCKGITLLKNKDGSYYKVEQSTANKDQSYNRQYYFYYIVNDWVEPDCDGKPIFVPRGNTIKKFKHTWKDEDKVEVCKLRNGHHIVTAARMKNTKLNFEEIEEEFNSKVEGFDTVEVRVLKKTYGDVIGTALERLKVRKYYQIK